MGSCWGPAATTPIPFFSEDPEDQGVLRLRKEVASSPGVPEGEMREGIDGWDFGRITLAQAWEMNGR